MAVSTTRSSWSYERRCSPWIDSARPRRAGASSPGARRHQCAREPAAGRVPRAWRAVAIAAVVVLLFGAGWVVGQMTSGGALRPSPTPYRAMTAPSWR